MKMAIYTFVPVSMSSKATGHTIARFIRDVTGVTLSHRVSDIPSVDVLGLMPGAAAYCNEREELGALVARVPRVVWIQDDYTCRVPTGGESPWRRAFTDRLEAGLDPVDYWTTVHDNALLTPRSALLNWNVVGYRKRDPITRITPSIFYYGVWRSGRRKFAERYFGSPQVRTLISSKPGNEYSQKFPGCEHVPSRKRVELVDWMRESGVGLCLEDEASTRHKNSPPRRFYEMLGAGVPMAFMPESVEAFRMYGYTLGEAVVQDASDLQRVVECRHILLQDQQQWCRDFRGTLAEQLRREYGRMTT
jgi:hypothetical protein